MTEQELMQQQQQAGTNNKRIEEQGNPVVDSTPDYLAAIKELKENTVDKNAYNKVLEENRKLIKAVMDGQQVAQQPVEVKTDIQALRKELYSGKKDLSNLDYVKKTLELREALMDQGEMDPFVGRGSKLTPDASDFETAERVAQKLKECVEYADGDSQIFTQELQRIMIDAAPMARKK